MPSTPVVVPPVDAPTLVLGVGTEHRGDDAVGLRVAERLRSSAPPAGATVLTLSTDGTRLIDAWDGAGLVVVVDALSSGGRPGAVERIEVGAAPLPSSTRLSSTHGISLAEAVALGQSLRRMPSRLVIYAIEGRRFGIGEPLSAEVEAAVAPVARRVAEEIARAPALRPDREAPHA
ncbi:MAG TPA: hydrogenase maturation protease [Thermoplasmata archaeon]|nr:hydrogenase maturation protease [Thermoplasmata archaeon]